MKRAFPWFILTGLVLGFVAGLLIAWGMPQATPANTSPASLRADFKDDYRFMIAAAYTLSGDLGRAQARLATLADADPLQALGEQAQRMLAQNAALDKVRVLANLSTALQAQPSPIPAPENGTSAPTPAAPLNPNDLTPATLPVSATTTLVSPPPTEATSPPHDQTATPPPTPILTATLRPTRTATSTPGAPFTLVNQATFCDPQKQGLLQIFLQNAASQPAPGVELILTWFGGEEHFFTGFKNEIGPGYADFTLTSGLEYALSLSGGSTRLTGLSAPACTGEAGKPYPGTILLEFKQP